MSANKFERARRLYEYNIIALWEYLEPIAGNIYKELEERQCYYTEENNFYSLFSDNHSIHGGIIDKNLFNGNRVMYIHSNDCKFIVIFLDNKTEKYGTGVLIFRVYSEIDIKCIEESWGCNTTEKWITNLDLTRETFTDVTKHSQVIGDLVHCSRPTINRISEDLKENKFLAYSPIFSTTGISGFDCSHIEFVMRSIILLGVRLEIEGVEL